MSKKESENKKSRHRAKIALGCVAAMLVLLVGAFFIYTASYYSADEAALGSVPAGVLVEAENGYTICRPAGQQPAVGYIFYPGAKVDEKAYLPYLTEVASEGYLCAVVKAPFHLAILGQDAAELVKQAYPEVICWVVGGHSLGGVAAAGYAAKGGAQGLVLLASYPSVDLSGSHLLVLSITGSNDEVLKWDSYEKAKQKLPPDTEYLQIEGGNHSGFGAYGHQSGDGTAGVPAQTQRQEVAWATAAFLAQCARA